MSASICRLLICRGRNVPICSRRSTATGLLRLALTSMRLRTTLEKWTGSPACRGLIEWHRWLFIWLCLFAGVTRADEVLVSTFTFVATANAVLQCWRDRRPLSIAQRRTGTSTPILWPKNWLNVQSVDGCLRLVVAVDLYGQCADYDRLEPICARVRACLSLPIRPNRLAHLGAGRRAGSRGMLAALSFNGNKIITTGGGGALVADDPALIERARYLSTQARLPAPHYEHIDAGLTTGSQTCPGALSGRGQLERLPSMMQRRAEIYRRYEDVLGVLPGIDFMPIPEDSQPNRWLTVATVDPAQVGTDRETIRLALEAQNIEARPAWKPMHLQPLFADAESVGSAVSEYVFASGLCLPTGSSMSDAQFDRVLDVLATAIATT